MICYIGVATMTQILFTCNNGFINKIDDD